MFGPHTFDLMSLDSNSRRDLHGNRLPHFTPCHTPESSGINVFAQQLPVRENLYVFLPLYLSVRSSVSLLTSIISTPHG